MRLRTTVVAIAIAIANALLHAQPADAWGTGSAVIVSPSSGSTVAPGFSGPYRVNLSQAPQDGYQWYLSHSAGPNGNPTTVVDHGTFAPNAGGGLQTVYAAAITNGYYVFQVWNDGVSIPRTVVEVHFEVRQKCSIIQPSRVTIDRPAQYVTARLGSDCAASDTEFASWGAVSQVGLEGIFVFDQAETDSIYLTDVDPRGRYTVSPRTAYSSTGNDVVQNTTSFTVKLGSRLSVTARRTRNYVTIRSIARRYVPTANAFSGWGGKAVTIEFRTCASCSWKTLRTVKADRSGQVSVRTSAPRARYYRALIAETPTVWGRTSATVRR